MRQRQAAGEQLEVDYAGMTVPVTSIETGGTRLVQVFVAKMGTSGYIYAEATDSQKRRTGQGTMSGCCRSTGTFGK